jgi:hypothetical protein
MLADVHDLTVWFELVCSNNEVVQALVSSI